MQEKENSNHGESEESKLIATTQPNTVVPLPFIPQADLPDEIALAILGYLSLIDLYRAMKVNKTWYRLIQDTRIWQPFINQYTKGHLWSYLLRQPNLAIYQTYFEEVFAEKGITFDNLDAIIESTQKKFSLSFSRSQISKDIRRSFLCYIQEAGLAKRMQATADQVQLLPLQLRTDFLAGKSNISHCPSVVGNINQLIPALRLINSLDVLLTEFIFVKKLTFERLYLHDFTWLLNSKWNVLLTPRTVIALTTYATVTLLKYTMSEPALFHIIQKFTQQDIMLAASLPLMNEVILQYPTFLDKLSKEDIVGLFGPLAISDSRENFKSLLQNNPDFSSRLDGPFLTQLADKKNALALPILTHPILLHRLNEEQCIKLMNMLFDEITTLLNTEVFWTFKTNNFSRLLLQYKYLPSLLSHPRAASQVSVTEVFKIACSLLDVAEALAQQPILLNQLGTTQLVQLANSHSAVALLLFKDSNLDSKWSFANLEEVKKNYETFRIFPQIKDAADAIRLKILTKNREQSAQLNFTDVKVVPRTNQPIAYPTEKREHPVPQNFKQMRIVRGAHRLEFQPVAPSPAPKRPDPPHVVNHPVFPQRAPKKPSVTPAQIIVTSLLILLGIAGVALLFSGIGAFMGAGFIVSALLMVNLKMSVATLASLLMIGGLTTGIASAYSLSFLYDDEPRAPKQNLAQPPAPNPPRETRPANLRPAPHATVNRDSGEPEPVYGSPLHRSIPRKQVNVEIKPAPTTLQI